jgi:dimethylamine monooxygenase subunit A
MSREVAGVSSPPSARLGCFPFPFPQDQYRYSTNIEPARRPVITPVGEWGRWTIDVDDEYEDELRQREEILAADSSRCVVLPHMRAACWDTLLECLGEAARANQGEMSLTRDGGAGAYVWSNARLGEERRFVVGDEDTLGAEPLAYTGSQVQEDLVLLDQREGQLWADAGLTTFAADWSLRFDIGMTFLEVHGPVPRVHVAGVIPRAHQFLLRLEAHHPYRRTNWTMSVGRRLDQSTEVYPEWGPDRAAVVRDPARLPDLLQLRVEVQHLIRLAGSGAVLFLIRTSMVSLRELAAVVEWRQRFAAVLRELPQDMVDYKGLTRFRDPAAAWLESPEAIAIGAGS